MSFYIQYPASAAGTNPSVGINGAPIPGESTLVAGENPEGIQQPLQTDNSGNLLVSINGEPSSPLNTRDAADGTPGAANPSTAIQVAGTDGTDLRTLSTNTSGQLNINNVSGTVSLPTGAATSANQTNGTQVSQVVQTTASNLNATVTPANGSTFSMQIAGTASANLPVYNVYSSTNITTSAYVQLVASTSNTINTIHIFDSSGQAMILGVGPSGSEIVQAYIQPGGDLYALNIPAGSRIAYKALTGNAVTGYLLMSFLE